MALDRKHQLDDALDCDLPQRQVVAVQEAVDNEVLHLTRRLIDSVHDEPVEDRLQCDDGLVQTALGHHQRFGESLDALLQNGGKHLRIIPEEIFVQESQQPNGLDADELALRVVRVAQRWHDQPLTDVDQVLVGDAGATLLKQDQTEAEGPLACHLLFELAFLEQPVEVDSLGKRVRDLILVSVLIELLESSQVLVELVLILDLPLGPVYDVRVVFILHFVLPVVHLDRLDDVGDDLQYLT